MSHSSHEIEIKLAVPDAPSARRLLRNAGFRVTRSRVFEANTIFDTPAGTLRKASKLLRIRTAGRIATLTYKGVPELGRVKSREEIELEIPDADTMTLIVGRLGYRPVFRYEKYRTEFAQPRRAGVAVVGGTPGGGVLGLGGAGGGGGRAAGLLGVSEGGGFSARYARPSLLL